MPKQTSIEWFNEQIINRQNGNGDSRSWDELLQQAQQMHKEEISESFEVGYENGACVYDGEFIYHGSNYYNKTYGGKNEN
jgi:hypothetical protein